MRRRDPRGCALLDGSEGGGRALATNRGATEIVLAAAGRARLDPIVHVSSYVARLPSHDVLDPDSPIGVGGPPYPRSKAESEVVACRYQAEGVPVVITYPGAVAGPHDPYFGDTAFVIAMILRNRIPFAVPGGWPVADVRYVADGHAGYQEPWIVTHCSGADSTTAREELGVEPRLLEETLGDTIRWMVEVGHLPARLAGNLA